MLHPNRRRTVLLWALALGSVIAAFAWAVWPHALPVATVAVVRAPLVVERVDQGYTRIRHVHAVAAPVAGAVERIMLEPGDAVAAGDVVARLEPLASQPLDARSAAEARAAVASARAQLAAARAAQQARDDALQRIEALAQRGLAAEGDRIAARSAAREARAQVGAAEAALRRAETTVAVQVEGDGRLVEVRAPIAGVVLRRHVDSAGPVAAGQVLLELGDPADLEVVAEFLSQDAVGFVPGAKATIEGWGGAPVPARVARVEPVGELKISALGVEERRVRVRLDFDSLPAGLGHGYQVDARVVADTRTDALVVPLEALVRDGSGWRAWVVVAGRVEARPVEVGATDGRMREIVQGLAAGETVVVDPPREMVAGTRVVEPAG
jgi:HlyD family secretion protein